MNNENKILLFDFDGVIVNTFEVGYACALSVVPDGLEREQYRRMFDGNIYDSHESKNNQGKDYKPVDDPFFKKYLPGLMATDPVPGMPEALKDLGKEHKMVIVSSSITSPIEEYLRTHDLFELFDEVYGADIHTSKRIKIQMTFEKYGVTSEDCLFITDTLGDMREASKEGVPAIGVSWGFQKKENLLKGSPVAVVDSVEELVKVIQENNL